MIYLEFLALSYKKGGMLMVSMIKVITGFSISYVAGATVPVLS